MELRELRELVNPLEKMEEVEGNEMSEVFEVLGCEAELEVGKCKNVTRSCVCIDITWG